MYFPDRRWWFKLLLFININEWDSRCYLTFLSLNVDNVGCHTSSVHFCISIQLHNKQNVNNLNNRAEPSSYFILDSYSKIYISVIISYWCILYPCLLGYIESLLAYWCIIPTSRVPLFASSSNSHRPPHPTIQVSI